MNLEIEGMPKVEMHLHLEGAARLNTYIELKKRSEPSFDVFDEPWYDVSYKFDNLDHFCSSVLSGLGCPADYYRVALEWFEELANQNVIYTEISIGTIRFPIIEIAQAVFEAWKKIKADANFQYGLLVGLFRERPPEAAVDLAKQSCDAKELGVVGIDLLGRESAQSACVFEAAFDIAREAGLGLRAHAGEGAGSESVWEVIRKLDVSRIGHGTNAIEDPDLVQFLIDEGVTLDMCPSSNVKLQVVDTIEKHPIRKLFDAGVRITASTDDPLFFRNSLTRELKQLHEVFGFTIDELLQLQRYGIESEPPRVFRRLFYVSPAITAEASTLS